MRKEMTPCERLGYKVGDEFEVIRHHAFKKGQVVTLHEDDDTECPLFAGDGGGAGVFGGVECSFATLNKQVRKIANKPKPAKQALADAINQNGGWVEGGEFAAQDKDGEEGCAIWFYSGGRPYKHDDFWYPSDNGEAIYGKHISCDTPFVNWHQTVLSRDEYFTAYPEQVKVEICNETKRKVEVEMESESEMTINVSDWHKNGELPPVGEVCLYVVSERLSVEVEITAHAKLGICFVQVGKSGEIYVSKVAELHRFRPLRTEREKAIDEMVDCLRSRLANCEAIAAHLYENGYRKEVK